MNNKYQPAPGESIHSFISFITCSIVVNEVKEELYFIEQKQKNKVIIAHKIAITNNFRRFFFIDINLYSISHLNFS